MSVTDPKHTLEEAHKWLDNDTNIEKFISENKFNLDELRKKGKANQENSTTNSTNDNCLIKNSNKGFLHHIENFLPACVAEALLIEVDKLQNWEIAAGEDDAKKNYKDAIDHRFSLSDILDADDEESEHQHLLHKVGNLFWKLYLYDESPDRKKSTIYTDNNNTTLKNYTSDNNNKTSKINSPSLKVDQSLRWEKTVPNFTAASYNKGDYIDPHDDFVLEDYTGEEVSEIFEIYEGLEDPTTTTNMDTNILPDITRNIQNSTNTTNIQQTKNEKDQTKPKTYERRLAMVYYLNKDWKSSMGGELLDIETGNKILPIFNSLVIFEVPRMHAVLPVKTKNRTRKSIFGWWLVEHHPVQETTHNNNSSLTDKSKKNNSKTLKSDTAEPTNNSHVEGRNYKKLKNKKNKNKQFAKKNFGKKKNKINRKKK